MSIWGGSYANAVLSNNYRDSKKKVLSDEAIKKLIYDAMSSDQGLASLASGENLSGGFKSSSKGLLAQDFMTKLIGELANVTAETVETKEADPSSAGGAAVRNGNSFSDLGTVICGELVNQGKLSEIHYRAGADHVTAMNETVRTGYLIWARPVVKLMQRSPRLSNFLAPIARSRYRVILGISKFEILGSSTIYIGHPICWLIGKVVQLVENFNGRSIGSSSAA